METTKAEEIAKKVAEKDGTIAVNVYDEMHGRYEDNVMADSTVSATGGKKLDPNPFSNTRTK